jgi:NSS family neurotransmitter:Na+ symporter
MLEAVVKWLEEQGMARRKAAISGGLAAWLVGLTTVLSLNVWSDFTPLDSFERFEGKTLFDLYDFLTANVMMPLVALLTAVFVGWVMKKASSEEELGAGLMHRIWLFVLRYLTPVGLVVLFLYNL